MPSVIEGLGSGLGSSRGKNGSERGIGMCCGSSFVKWCDGFQGTEAAGKSTKQVASRRS